MQTVSMIALVVRDYDEAIAYYTAVLGFDLIEDKMMTAEKRWVVVSPTRSTGARLLLAKAANREQELRVGNQTGGRVFLFIDTDNFSRDYANYVERGVKFIAPPRKEEFGTVAIFEDLYGNKWDLVERTDCAA